MAQTIRFIHASDMHLGAPIRGLCNVLPAWAARLQQAIAESFERVIQAALDRNVDFVIMAGDAFDTSRPSYGDYCRFFQGLERLHEANIPVYLVTGNHDPYTIWARDVGRLPASAHMMGVNAPEFQLFSKDDQPLCLIGARSYYNQTWPDDEQIAAGITRAAAEAALVPEFANAAEAPFAVGVIHTGLNLDIKKAPADEDQLLQSGMDYWACGHLHKRMVRPSESNPRIVFSGCIQGRDIKETGERGCYEVQLSTNAAPSLRFIPTSSVVFQQLKVDVSACATLADVRRLVQAELFHENGKLHCDEMVSRITLTGSTPLHDYLLKPEVIQDLRNHVNNAYPSFFCDVLRSNTQPQEGVADKTANAAGPFVSIVAEMADEQSARQDVLINYAQSELVKRGIAVPGSLARNVATFNTDAETLVRDLLREEEQ